MYVRTGKEFADKVDTGDKFHVHNGAWDGVVKDKTKDCVIVDAVYRNGEIARENIVWHNEDVIDIEVSIMPLEDEIITLKLRHDELKMLVEKLKWMRCVVKDSVSLKYSDYCDGDCDNCVRKGMDFETWINSRVTKRGWK